METEHLKRCFNKLIDFLECLLLNIRSLRRDDWLSIILFLQILHSLQKFVLCDLFLFRIGGDKFGVASFL